MNLSRAEMTRYQRHLALSEIGAEGQAKLKAGRVLLVGLGGLGCPAALYLAASGVGTIGLLDDDRVDISNLQRQVLYTTQDVGRLKVEVAYERLTALNPEIRIVTHATKLSAANVHSTFEHYDVILDGTDRFSARYLTNDACVLMRKTLISAAIHGFRGQLFTYVPGGPCYRCLFADPPGNDAIPNCADAGVLGVLPGVLGTLQATEAIKLLVGRGDPLVGRLLAYDALALRFDQFQFTCDPECKVCGDHPVVLAPADVGSAAVRKINVEQLHALLESSAIALIDVREADEFSDGHIEGSLNIPLSALEHRAAELPDKELIVFVCRSGARSSAACERIAPLTDVPVATLEGGFIAWTARRFDSSRRNGLHVRHPDAGGDPVVS